MENNGKILEKIKKLMLHKQSAEEIGSTKEAEAFAVKIQKLLNEHNLSLGDINLEQRKNNFVKEKGLDAKSTGFKGRSAYLIMDVIAKFNWCQAYSNGSGKYLYMTIIGSPENIEICKYLHSVIYPVAVKLGKAEYRKFINNDMAVKLGLIKPSRGKYMRAFMDGFKKGLSVKFQEEKDKFKRENSIGTSIIVCNDAALKEFESESIGKVGSFKTKISQVGDANRKGYESGRNVEITRGLDGKENSNVSLG